MKEHRTDVTSTVALDSDYRAAAQRFKSICSRRSEIAKRLAEQNEESPRPPIDFSEYAKQNHRASKTVATFASAIPLAIDDLSRSSNWSGITGLAIHFANEFDASVSDLEQSYPHHSATQDSASSAVLWVTYTLRPIANRLNIVISGSSSGMLNVSSASLQATTHRYFFTSLLETLASTATEGFQCSESQVLASGLIFAQWAQL